MTDTLYIRRAVATDLPRLMELFSAARAFMRSQGNFAQWTGGYPSSELIAEGVSRGEQWVVCRDKFVSSCVSSSPHPPREKDDGFSAEIVATFWFAVAPEPTYAEIFDGRWLSGKTKNHDDALLFSSKRNRFRADRGFEGGSLLDVNDRPKNKEVRKMSVFTETYGVVHRLASDGSVPGVGALVLRWALARCGDVRVDTHRDNSLMQSLLRREGFTHCGTIFLADGSPRDAFERVLSVGEAKKMLRTVIAMNRNFSSEWRSGKAHEDSDAYATELNSMLNAASPLLSRKIRTVALFCALPDEPSVDFLLDKWLGIKRLVLPVVISPPASSRASVGQSTPLPEMEFREYTGPDCLRKGHFGILEPFGTPLVPPEEIDLMFVPGVAYTADGQRLGRGGGFYDSYLSQPAAGHIYKVGVCAPNALVEWLPTEEHDVMVDEILIAE